MKRWACIAALALAGCAEIPDPEARPAWDAGAPPDAALGDGGYAGPCKMYGSAISRGQMPTALRTAPSGPGVAVRAAFRFAIPEVDEINRIELFTVGVPAELRGQVTDLGAGINAALSTCVHCMLVYRQCAFDGYDSWLTAIQNGESFLRRIPMPGATRVPRVNPKSAIAATPALALCAAALKARASTEATNG